MDAGAAPAGQPGTERLSAHRAQQLREPRDQHLAASSFPSTSIPRAQGSGARTEHAPLGKARDQRAFPIRTVRTFFYGPITGGFAGDEPLVPGERIIPAFDQTHTGTAQVFYHNRWRGFWGGTAMRYGSGTIVEGGARLPQHFTADLATGVTLWNAEPRKAGSGVRCHQRLQQHLPDRQGERRDSHSIRSFAHRGWQLEVPLLTRIGIGAGDGFARPFSCAMFCRK